MREAQIKTKIRPGTNSGWRSKVDWTEKLRMGLKVRLGEEKPDLVKQSDWGVLVRLGVKFRLRSTIRLVSKI